MTIRRGANQPHNYFPDAMHMGDCAVCGNVEDAQIHRRASNEKVDHPAHYGGADNPYEAIKVIENWGLGFCLGNAVKYIARAGHKPGEAAVLDLKKALHGNFRGWVQYRKILEQQQVRAG